jgi:hypothetical protein
MLSPMFMKTQLKKTQRRAGLAATLCWLLSSTLSCSVMAVPVSSAPGPDTEHAHVMEMSGHSAHAEMTMDDSANCCDQSAVSCCEPASLVVPSKSLDASDLTALVAQVPPTEPILLVYFSPPTGGLDRPWQYQTSPPRIHLLNCSFLA